MVGKFVCYSCGSVVTNTNFEDPNLYNVLEILKICENCARRWAARKLLAEPVWVR